MLTADHGESLREHGELTHGLFAYDATLRVPLILHEPHRVGARVVSEPMRHVDILPTVLDAIDGAAPTGAAPAKTHFTDADDPKRLVDVDHQIEEVVSR